MSGNAYGQGSGYGGSGGAAAADSSGGAGQGGGQEETSNQRTARGLTDLQRKFQEAAKREEADYALALRTPEVIKTEWLCKVPRGPKVSCNTDHNAGVEQCHDCGEWRILKLSEGNRGPNPQPCTDGPTVWELSFWIDFTATRVSMGYPRYKPKGS